MNYAFQKAVKCKSKENIWKKFPQLLFDASLVMPVMEVLISIS